MEEETSSVSVASVFLGVIQTITRLSGVTDHNFFHHDK